MTMILEYHPDQIVLKVESAISFRYKKGKKINIFIDVLSANQLESILDVWNKFKV